MNRIFLAAACAVAVNGASASAQHVVRSDDLRLERQADVRKLDRRIVHAVRAACGTAPDYDLLGRNRVTRCRRETRASVAAHRDRLVALSRERAIAAR
jgi:UrcA family protein